MSKYPFLFYVDGLIALFSPAYFLLDQVCCLSFVVSGIQAADKGIRLDLHIDAINVGAEATTNKLEPKQQGQAYHNTVSADAHNTVVADEAADVKDHR